MPYKSRHGGGYFLGKYSKHCNHLFALESFHSSKHMFDAFFSATIVLRRMEPAAQKNIEKEIVRLLSNTRHEMHVQCVRDWYAKKGVKKAKKKCRKVFLKKEEYLEVNY